MACRTWWITASITFLVGMIMGLFGFIFKEATVGAYLVLGNIALVVAGWVLWVIGFVSYLRRR